MNSTTKRIMKINKCISPSNIFFADRKEHFFQFLRSVFYKTGVPEHVANMLTEKRNMIHYNSAFTSIHVSKTQNYEPFEQLGDAVAQHFLVQYSYQRFPNLFIENGVSIVARIKIKYGSKNTFADIADKLGFFDFISETHERRGRCKKDLLEDVFESFLGATEFIMNINRMNGYMCFYDILKSCFDKIHIPLTYENLFDPKTRLKELFDKNPNDLFKLEYKSERINNKVSVLVLNVAHNGTEIIGRGFGNTLIAAKMDASTNAIEFLRKNKNVYYKGDMQLN